MNFNVFKRKKKKSQPKATAPKAPEPEAKAAPAAPKSPPQPPQEATPPTGPRPRIRRGACMDELDRMSRVPGMRNLEVTTSRNFRWTLRDPVDGRDYEYYYQDQGPPAAHLGGMQGPPARHMGQALPPPAPPPYLQHGPPGPPVASSHPCYDYGHGGAPSAYSYPPSVGGGSGSGYYEDEYPRDCVLM